MKEIAPSANMTGLRRSTPGKVPGSDGDHVDYVCPTCDRVVMTSEALERSPTEFAAQCPSCSTWCALP